MFCVSKYYQEYTDYFIKIYDGKIPNNGELKIEECSRNSSGGPDLKSSLILKKVLKENIEEQY